MLLYCFQLSPSMCKHDLLLADENGHSHRYSNASISDANYSNAGACEAVKAHNRGLAHVQNSYSIIIM